MSLGMCFKDKLFVSKARYKSCCDERLQGAAVTEGTSIDSGGDGVRTIRSVDDFSLDF